MEPVHVFNAALDEVATTRGNQIVLRGVIHPRSLNLLRIAGYQREALPDSSLTSLWEALKNRESLPDIELGMRGYSYDNKPGSDEFFLRDPVYVIDGQQRRNAALRLLEVSPDHDVRLGAMIHFNTGEEWERERFRILNLLRTKVSPNVLIRNARHDNVAVLTLYGLSTNDPKFALFERVCWKQKRTAGDLMTALTLAKVATMLHTHRGGSMRNSLTELLPNMNRQAQFVGLGLWRQNVAELMELVDGCFGIRSVQIAQLAVHMRVMFQSTLAMVLSDHADFWKGEDKSTLFVEAELRRKLATFPLHDQGVIQICTAGGTPSRSLLYGLLVEHLNSGKRTKRLTKHGQTNELHDEVAEEMEDA